MDGQQTPEKMLNITNYWAFFGGSAGKESACNVGDQKCK